MSLHMVHYSDVIISAIASQITSLNIVHSNVYLGTYQRKHQSSAPLAFEWGIHRWPVNSPHKGPVTRKMFPFDDVIMLLCFAWLWWHFQFCRLIWSYNTFPSGMLRWCLFSSFGSTRVSAVALADMAESRHFLTIRYCKSWIIYIITWVSVCLHTLL